MTHDLKIILLCVWLCVYAHAFHKFSFGITVRVYFSLMHNNTTLYTLFSSSLSVHRYIPIQFLYLITWISGFLISVYWPNVQLSSLKRSAISIYFAYAFFSSSSSSFGVFGQFFLLLFLNLCYIKMYARHERRKKTRQDERSVCGVEQVRKM